jgi:hypothetical protein
MLVDPTGHVGVCFYGGPAAGDADPNDLSTTTQLCLALDEKGLLGKKWDTFNNRAKDVQAAYDFILNVLANAETGEPVVIGGYSWGGGAALELAKMLNEAGDTSEVSDNVLRAINVYAGAQDFPTSDGIENLKGALNVEGSNPVGGEATRFSLMNVERGDLNPRTRDQITRLMQRPWLPLNFR